MSCGTLLKEEGWGQTSFVILRRHHEFQIHFYHVCSLVGLFKQLNSKTLVSNTSIVITHWEYCSR